MTVVGGGRIFFIENDCLKVYDPQVKKSMLLLEEIKNPEKIYKKACVIFMECKDETIEFDLSSMTKSKSERF